LVSLRNVKSEEQARVSNGLRPIIIIGLS